MLKGRESLIRLVGKRRRCLPNRQSLLSSPTQSSLNLRADENGKFVSIDNVEGSSNQEEQGNTEYSAVGLVDERVTCPVCGNKVSGQSNIINSHLDVCLSRGTKRKLTQRTLLELNFCPDSKAQIRTCYSKELGNDLFHAAHDDSHVQRVVHGLSDISAVEESADDVCGSSLNLMDDMQNQVGMCGNPILKDRINANVDDLSWALKNEVPDVEMTVTLDDISGVILETFIVGRKFCDGNELDLGARISLLRDPDNPKDPNAIKVISSDSGCRKVLGFLPRKLAQYLSPLMEKYFLNFEIMSHKTGSRGAKVYYNDEAFKCLWKNAQQVIESTKSCPPSAVKYQENFCVFIHDVLKSNSHLLTEDEKNFIELFTSLSDDSQRLFVRLYTRKGPWFRQSAISYPEVLDPEQAVKGLSELQSCHEKAGSYCVSYFFV